MPLLGLGRIRLEKRSKADPEEIVEGMRALRKRVKPDAMSVREMVNEGRRF